MMNTAAVLVQYPNFFGQIEDIEKMAKSHMLQKDYLLFRLIHLHLVC